MGAAHRREILMTVHIAKSGNPTVKGLLTANDDALTRAKSINQSSSPYDVRVMWRARKRNTTAVVASTVNATTAPTTSLPRLWLSQGTAAEHISRILTMASD